MYFVTEVLYMLDVLDVRLYFVLHLLQLGDILRSTSTCPLSQHNMHLLQLRL